MKVINKDTKYTFCVDVDGTIWEHEYPNRGQDVPMAAEVLKELQSKGHKIIILSMRSDEYLDEVIQWYIDKNIKVYGVNYNPSQKSWTTSPKVFGNFYIDDAALGCPLVYGQSKRPYVDWNKIKDILIEKNIL